MRNCKETARNRVTVWKIRMCKQKNSNRNRLQIRTANRFLAAHMTIPDPEVRMLLESKSKKSSRSMTRESQETESVWK